MTPARISSLGSERRVKCLMTDVQVKLRKGGRIVSLGGSGLSVGAEWY